MGAGDARQEAAQDWAVHGAGRFQQGHGGERGRINGEACLAEACESLRSLQIILAGTEIIQAGRIQAGRTCTGILRILGVGGVLRIIAVRRLAI